MTMDGTVRRLAALAAAPLHIGKDRRGDVGSQFALFAGMLGALFIGGIMYGGYQVSDTWEAFRDLVRGIAS